MPWESGWPIYLGLGGLSGAEYHGQSSYGGVGLHEFEEQINVCENMFVFPDLLTVQYI